LVSYQSATPGALVLDGATTILNDDSEPQPDNALILLPDVGGQTHEDEREFLHGAPEFIVEVASSSESYDLHSKKRDYERAGVLEYVVLALRQERVAWFVRRERKFVLMEPDSDGMYRSTVFPGLWLDPDALIRRDSARVQQVLNLGLASAEHARFVQQLAEKRMGSSNRP
jgi:Uma2 family endonuclease